MAKAKSPAEAAEAYDRKQRAKAVAAKRALKGYTPPADGAAERAYQKKLERKGQLRLPGADK